MLTKERLSTIQEHPCTQEDLTIKVLYENKGSLPMKELSELTGFTTIALGIVVKDSFYLRKNRNLVCLERKGKRPDKLEENPYHASSMHGFIFSLIYQKYMAGMELKKISYKYTLDEVIVFCSSNKIDCSHYVEYGHNIYATYKKEVKQYLQTIGKA